MADRDFESPEYRAWRFSCLKRDGWRCAMTGKKGGDLEIHHIIPWSVAPNLRYVVSNGITLCKEAHEMVTGREEQFEEQFKKIIIEKKALMGRIGNKVSKKFDRGFRKKWKPRDPNLRYG